MKAQRLYVIKTAGKYPELGGVTGPILTPIPISEKIVVDLVNRGVAVYEVNPANHNDMVRVTFRNIKVSKFLTKYEAEKKRARDHAKNNKQKYSVHDRVAQSYGKGNKDNSEGYGGFLPRGKKTTVVEQPSEKEQVKAEKAEKKESAENTSEGVETSSQTVITRLKSSDF